MHVSWRAAIGTSYVLQRYPCQWSAIILFQIHSLDCVCYSPCRLLAEYVALCCMERRVQTVSYSQTKLTSWLCTWLLLCLSFHVADTVSYNSPSLYLNILTVYPTSHIRDFAATSWLPLGYKPVRVRVFMCSIHSESLSMNNIHS